MLDEIGETQNIQSQIKYFVDTTAEVNLDMVKPKISQPYSQNQFPSFLLKEYRFNYWFKLCIYNKSVKSQKILFSMGDVYKQVIYVQKKGKTTQKIVCSQDKRINTNTYSFDYKYAPILLNAHEEIELVVMLNDLPGKRFLLNPQLLSPTTEKQNRLTELYNERFAFSFNILLNSILFFVFLFVCVQFIIVRQPYLLYYALYVFCMMCFHLYGFSYSSYIKTPLSFIPFLQFDLRQNFYVIITQIFYMLFLKEFFMIEQVGSFSQKFFFKYIHLVFLVLLGIELFFSLFYVRLDIEVFIMLITQILIVLISIYLLIMIFYSPNLNSLLSIKLASFTLLLGVIMGFLSATFEWVQTTSPLLIYYPNYFFNVCVLSEIFLYSLAIGQLYFRNISEKSSLIQKISHAELNTLRSQMNPHFIFNSLNSIKSLIIKNKNKEAAVFLTDLSLLLRSILQKSREQFLSLEEELKFTEDYLKIEQMRFEKNFEYSIHIEHKEWLLSKMIPSFLLQPFVENSIKHGFNGIEKEGKIMIQIKPLQENIIIEITDNGIGRENASKLKLSEAKHTSMGTTLIEERLKIINEVYGWQISYHITDLQNPSGTKVHITIPYFE